MRSARRKYRRRKARDAERDTSRDGESDARDASRDGHGDGVDIQKTDIQKTEDRRQNVNVNQVPTTPPSQSGQPKRGGGGVGPTIYGPEDFTAEQYVAWNVLLKAAPDFNDPEGFIRNHDAYAVAVWSLAADNQEGIDNPAGFVAAGVEKGSYPALRGGVKESYYAMLRLAEGWRPKPNGNGNGKQH